MSKVQHQPRLQHQTLLLSQNESTHKPERGVFKEGRIPLLNLVEGPELMLVPATGCAEHRPVCTIYASVAAIPTTQYANPWTGGSFHGKND